MNYRFEKLGQPQLKQYVLSEVKELQNLIFSLTSLIALDKLLLYISSDFKI